MIIVMFSIVLVVLAVLTILIAVPIKHLWREVDELKEKLEFLRLKLKYVESCELVNEKRLDQLEKVLELKKYFDEEPLNEEKK